MNQHAPGSPRLPLSPSPRLPMERVFIKFGGSFISPKRTKREVLLGARIQDAAREICRALDYASKHGADTTRTRFPFPSRPGRATPHASVGRPCLRSAKP